jgi:hypothetical protein
MWSAYSGGAVPKFLGPTLVADYRTACLRRFGAFRAVSLAILVVLVVVSFFMIRDLWKRWTYVEILKTVTLDESGESFPFAAPEELGRAYTLFPHRREVPFVLARMSRLLAFDDETDSYNTYVARFLKAVPVDEILDRYRDPRTFGRYEGAIDPAVYLARLTVSARADDVPSLRKAVDYLRAYRPADGEAQFSRLVYEHELAGRQGDRDGLRRLHGEMTRLFAELRAQTASPRAHIERVASHVFQEVLDHYAQVQIETAGAGAAEQSAAATRAVQVYARILALRKNIANAAEVPWLEGPGKLTLYQYFKHRVGRESNITRAVVELLTQLPDLPDAMDKRLFEAEAFKEFRALDTWDKGTPLHPNWSGKGMHDKVVQWLKSGW